jgi:1-aminocyclopropane-1-carboxylate deaminase/D-cysteine desulfhydrase-like pyridoxal-dependent ACC family enzyme
MTSKNTGLQTLFTAMTIGKTVMIFTGTANKLQVRAFPEVLARSRRLGAFRETYSLDGTDVQLRFVTATLEQVEAVLADMKPEHLTDVIAELELAIAKHAAADTETARVDELSIAKFGELLFTRSAQKLRSTASHAFGNLVLTTSTLIPVTHFKVLAKLAKYERKTKRFTITVSDLDATTRSKLLELADKLARSTKIVTHADIADRKAKRMATLPATYGVASDDLIEDFMYDVYGYDSAQNRQWAQEAFTK